MIILLSAGKLSETESVEDVIQTISAGKRLTGDVTIMTFGLKTGQQSNSNSSKLVSRDHEDDTTAIRAHHESRVCCEDFSRTIGAACDK